VASLLEDIPNNLPVGFQHIHCVQQGVFRTGLPKLPKFSNVLCCIVETQIRQVKTY
jgi:hypothetical protein